MNLGTIIATVRVFALRFRREDGQTLAEYGILVSVIAIIVIAAAVLLGSSVSALFSSSAHKI